MCRQHKYVLCRQHGSTYTICIRAVLLLPYVWRELMPISFFGTCRVSIFFFLRPVGSVFFLFLAAGGHFGSRVLAQIFGRPWAYRLQLEFLFMDV